MKSGTARPSPRVRVAHVGPLPLAGARGRRGFTLVEVMITLAIFVGLAGIAMMAVKSVVGGWSSGERRRVLYERAGGVLDMFSDDLRLVLSMEPKGSTEIKTKFISDLDRTNNQQRLMFVRSFEAGPERAIVGNAGDGRPNDMMLKPSALGDGSGSSATPGALDSEDYTGLKVGDFKPLGGMAMVAYFVKDQTLYRAIRAPVQGSMTALLNPGAAQVLSTDVLYFDLAYWGQETTSWEDPPPRTKPDELRRYPQRIWDSTRGIATLQEFPYHRENTVNDASDDIFPRKVRVTMTIDSPMPRCVFTRLVHEVGESDTTIVVDSTQNFPDGGEEDSFILIGDEWMHVKKKTEDTFVIDERGARATASKAHAKDAIVRCGRTFHRVVFVPNGRDNFVSDEIFKARKEAEMMQAKRTRRPAR